MYVDCLFVSTLHWLLLALFSMYMCEFSFIWLCFVFSKVYGF